MVLYKCTNGKFVYGKNLMLRPLSWSLGPGIISMGNAGQSTKAS